MDYTKLKKEELLDVIAELEPLAEKGKELVHLPKAIEAKDKEINALKEAKDKEINALKEAKDKEINALKEAKDKEINALKEAKDQLIEKKDVALKELEKRLAEKYETEYLELKTRTDAELKKTKDALAESQKKNYDLDALRIKQLEEVLYAYGDFLKLTQAAVDSHMKLNEYIVNGLQGGSK